VSEKVHVLVVDDNEEFCENLADILELNGYEVTVAHSGAEGVARTSEAAFGVALMDVRMPLVDGVEAFRRMKETAPRMPVIMMTAFTVEELLEDTLREGAFAALHKPIDFDELFATLDTARRNGGLALIVDDDPDFASNLSDILEARGCLTRVAHDGEAALAMVRASAFDVMILDLNLPTLNGLEVFLAARDIRPTLTTVLVTGFPQETSALAQAALAQSAYVCLEKPLDMESLLELVRRLVRREPKLDG